ncbi:MAG: zinc ribbon domain-containing protein [Chloroflexaceae bacterium]|nr:zinc ribbon domain-containing protein [Chloroflexaceae bacterium]
MPIYEYICHDCRARFQKLVRGFQDPEGLTCPRCQSITVRRAISRFATVKSEEARMESLADPANFAGLDETDPRSIAQWAKRMGKELGEEAGEDWDTMVEQMIEEEFQDEGDGKQGGAASEEPIGWA